MVIISIYLDDCDDESGVVEREVAALEAAINGVVGQGKGGDHSQAPSQSGGVKTVSVGGGGGLEGSAGASQGGSSTQGKCDILNNINLYAN